MVVTLQTKNKGEKTMKTEFIEKCKTALGTNIDNFIRSNYVEKGSKARIQFVEQVNDFLGMSNEDEQVGYKKVSRWISGETFPDLITIVAISKVMDKGIDELFSSEIDGLMPTASLTHPEKKVLKNILQDCWDKKTLTVYIPYAFRGKEFYTNKGYFTREEIVALYKQKAADACRVDRLEEYNALQKNGSKLNGKTHFSRFCNVAFLENHDSESRESIFYDNEEDYYAQITNVWEEYGQNDFFNAVFFEERVFDFHDYADWRAEKAYYYQKKSHAKTIYAICFSNLIKTGIITPCKPRTDIVEFENIIDEVTFNHDMNLTTFTDNDYDYPLDTISFSFDVNLTITQIREILNWNL